MLETRDGVDHNGNGRIDYDLRDGEFKVENVPMQGVSVYSRSLLPDPPPHEDSFLDDVSRSFFRGLKKALSPEDIMRTLVVEDLRALGERAVNRGGLNPDGTIKDPWLDPFRGAFDLRPAWEFPDFDGEDNGGG